MKTSFMVCLLCVLATSGYAEKQDANPVCIGYSTDQTPDREAFKQKIRAHKIAFFTEKLSLTPEEAQKFWPLYNTYFDSRDKLMSDFFQETRCKDCGCKKWEECEFDISKLSDAEVTKLVNDKAKLIDLEKKFHNDLCKLFSPQRVLTFYNTEREFQRFLINHHREIKTKVTVMQPPKKRAKGNPHREFLIIHTVDGQTFHGTDGFIFHSSDSTLFRTRDGKVHHVVDMDSDKK